MSALSRWIFVAGASFSTGRLTGLFAFWLPTVEYADQQNQGHDKTMCDNVANPLNVIMPINSAREQIGGQSLPAIQTLERPSWVDSPHASAAADSSRSSKYCLRRKPPP
jgi:hypothetical protein